MPECCHQKMSRAELRSTETRELLLMLLHEATGPIAPPDIVTLCHEAGRKANKTTIYRDLAALEQAGIVHRVIVSDRKQYFELTERGHHHHLICTECSAVEDVLLDESDFLKQGKSLAKESGFSILRHSLEFFGRCKLCTIK